MIKYLLELFLSLFFLHISFISFSQIKVVERSHTNVSLVGKISHTAAFQTGGLSRKLPTADALKVIIDEDIDAYKHENYTNNLRKEANDTYKSVGVRGMAWAAGEEFSASLLHFKDRDKFLLSFQNSSYNYQMESFWLSEQTKMDLHELIKGELEEKIKFKQIEVILDNNIVLVLSINKKKVSLNFWDGYNWVQSYWYRLFKINNLFGE
tara:strand:- start:256 stop:882 length:627 start_codon:yes stop_codon:yes gene_type:complete